MKKILVRVPQWLGDAVVSTVFLKRLRDRAPESHISVLCAASLVEIFATHPAVNSVLSLERKSVNLAVRLIREQKFDEAYVLPRSFRTALEVWLAKIPRRIGFSGDGRRLFLTEAVPYNDHLLYPHRYLKLIGEETLPLKLFLPHFPSHRPSEDKIHGIFGRSWEELKKPFLGLAPISVAPARTWDGNRFAEVASGFVSAHGGTVLFFGSAGERSRIDPLVGATSAPAYNTAGHLSLGELGWVLSQCDYFVANDSGLMHVAACFEVPAVILFGASDPRYAVPPWGTFVSLQHKEVPCVPCLRNQCVRWGSHYKECLQAISTQEVLGALKMLVEKRHEENRLS